MGTHEYTNDLTSFFYLFRHVTLNISTLYPIGFSICHFLYVLRMMVTMRMMLVVVVLIVFVFKMFMLVPIMTISSRRSLHVSYIH